MTDGTREQWICGARKWPGRTVKFSRFLNHSIFVLKTFQCIFQTIQCNCSVQFNAYSVQCSIQFNASFNSMHIQYNAPFSSVRIQFKLHSIQCIFNSMLHSIQLLTRSLSPEQVSENLGTRM